MGKAALVCTILIVIVSSAGTYSPGHAVLGVQQLATSVVETPGAAWALPARSGQTWLSEPADAPKLFKTLGPHSMVVDSSGHPHIAYGGDHLYYAWHDGTAWHYETVDRADATGFWPSLALDAADQPHISYSDGLTRTLRYAYYDGTTWQITTVVTAGADLPSLALDAAGRPHIAYSHWGTGGGLRYTYHDGTAWKTVTVDGSCVGIYPSLALDAAGRPHISYGDAESQDLRYAYDEGTGWITTTVDNSDWTGEYTSLALDAAGHPHIAYYTYYDGQLFHLAKYAHFDGMAWQIVTIGVPGSGNGGTSLALDAAGRPHISFWGVQYAFYDGSSWQLEVVDSGGSGMNDSTALALDGAGEPYIAYYKEVPPSFGWLPNELCLARRSGDAWQVEVVDRAADVGYDSSLAIDPNGLPHASFYDWTNQDLKYAHFDGTDWRAETVDSAGEVGHCSSLALDAAGRPRVAYFGPGGLQWAHLEGTVWQTATVDSSVGMYGCASLRLDAAGWPHIVYSAHPYVHVKYALLDDTGWEITTVVSSTERMWTFSLALDAGGRPHVALGGESGLKYAYYDGTQWQIGTVDSDARGAGGDLEIDPAGYPQIGYWDEYSATVNYARYDGTVWQHETVASGWVSSMALDAAGRPHLSYRDVAGLQYAFYDGVAWHIEHVPGVRHSGGFNALALDAAGAPHITYYDPDNGDLGYAWQCTAAAGAAVAGPRTLAAGQFGTYQAFPVPITASLPLTFAWDNGAAGPTTRYSWRQTGTYTLTVAATNACGQGPGSMAVRVIAEWPYRFYIPLIVKY